MDIRGLKMFFFLILFWGCLSGCAEKEGRRVLVLHSYEESYVGYPEYERLINKAFQKRDIQPDLKVLYLDCESYQEKAELQRMSSFLDSMADWKPEIIIVNDDQATYSLLKCDHPLAKEIPIVFGGVNYPNWKLIKHCPNVTGFHDKIDFKANMEMAKNIFGKSIRLFTLLDTTFLDKRLRADFKIQIENKKISGFRDVLTDEYRALEKKGYKTILAIPVRQREVGGNAGLMWYLSKYLKNCCYLQVKRDFTTVNVSNIAHSPSLTAINEGFALGEKLLGGYFTPLSIQVEEQVEAATRILHGEKPANIGIKESEKKHQVDWNIMKRLSIPIDKIPSQYTIINMPFNVKYRLLWIAMLSISGLSLLSLIIWLTFLYRREQKRKKKALFALADEKESLALAIEGSDTYVWKFEEGMFLLEKAFWQSIDVQVQDLTIDDLIRFIHPDHRHLFIKHWKRLPDARKEIIQVLADFNGKGYQWWEFRYTTTRLGTGKHRTAGLLLNIEAFKRREQELEDARKLAEKAELKESFLANMSHEIRTPLNAIVGFSTLLASDEEIEPDEKQEYIGSIHRNNELLLKLINDILELSRIKSGYMSFTFEKCLVEDIVNQIYITHQMLIPPQLEFKKQTEVGVSLEIDIDKNRFSQIITNFLSNACKFTKEGSITIGYKFNPEKEEVEVYVEDTGQGIEPAEKEIIFNRFYKHDEFAQGAGLGLSICQSIIEKLNGRIELWSEKGKGSRFAAILPCKVIL